MEFGKKKLTSVIFILNNFTPYTGDEKFLEGPTEATISYGIK